MKPDNQHPQAQWSAWTDGACQCPGNRIGGWAFVLERPDGSIVEHSGGEFDTTANRMEMTAAIEVLRNIPHGTPAVIYSDSRLTVEIFSGRWRGKKNRDLIGLGLSLMKHRSVRFEWVKGHSGNVRNERADELANKAMRELDKVNYPEPDLAVLMGERVA